MHMRSTRRDLLHSRIFGLRHTAFLAVVCATLAFGQASAALSDENDIAVRTSKEGDNIIVDVDLAVQASQDEVWSVLTDYDRMAQFVANLEASTIISRTGNTLDVMQKGTARYGLLSFPFESVRRVVLTPFRQIHSTIVSGDMTGSEITTRVASDGAMTKVSVRSQFVPTIWLPPVVGLQVIASQTRKQWFTLREEILRRRALIAEPAPAMR
jgi:Polyketide cyclase / dehydrase and lipid transport